MIKRMKIGPGHNSFGLGEGHRHVKTLNKDEINSYENVVLPGRYK